VVVKQSVRKARRTRYVDAGDGNFVARDPAVDWVAVEEPLEIRVSGERWLTTMRTPGHDRELTAGLLLAEGVIHRGDELAAIVHCGRLDSEEYGNVVDVSLAPGGEAVWRRLDEKGRAVLTTSACGVCGREAIDDLLRRCSPLVTRPRVDLSQVALHAQRLVSKQETFALTGGVHAASLLREDGECLGTFEDVGRHNAVDKVIGERVLHGEPRCDDLFLCVSGRISFEIVQKAVVARCRGVLGVSAPTTLAIETAERFNLLLVGFLRNDGFNQYCGTDLA
jgi:FdhD protein